MPITRPLLWQHARFRGSCNTQKQPEDALTATKLCEDGGKKIWPTSKRTINGPSCTCTKNLKKSSLHFPSLWRRTASICFDSLPREKRVPSSAEFSVLRRRLRRMENRKSSHRPAETTKRGFRSHSPTNRDSERRTAWSCQSHVHSSGSMPDFADLATLKNNSKT